jgi:hypothetical protein
MDTELAPIDVAMHWPYVRRNLHLERAEPIRRALGILSDLQCDAGGQPVRLGRKVIVTHGARLMPEIIWTPGVAGAVYNALVDLERRNVVKRWRGRGGREADAWSLHGDLGHWRSMPWGTAGKTVGTAVRGCICSTFRAVAARNPGQSVAGSVQNAEFWLSVEDHTRPPGLLSVDSRGYGATRAATARPPGLLPVDSRGYGAELAPLTVLRERTVVLSLTSEERERFDRLRKVVDHHAAPGSGVWPGSSLQRTLEALSRELDEGEAAIVVRQFDMSAPANGRAPGLVGMIEQIAQVVLGRRRPKRAAWEA